MGPNREPSLTFVAPDLPMRLVPLVPLDDDALFDLCQRNPELRIERTPEGDLLVMPPTGGETGRRNANLIADLTLWSRQDSSGVVFDSSTGFLLPDGSERSADAAWSSRRVGAHSRRSRGTSSRRCARTSSRS